MRYLRELRHPKQQKSLYLLLSLESFFIAWALMQITRVGTRHLLTALFFLLGLVLVGTVSRLAAKKYFQSHSSHGAVDGNSFYLFLSLWRF